MIEMIKQLVLAMENTIRLDFGSDAYKQFNAAIKAGKQAIAELESQEPVKLPCCGYTDASAVKWNPFNGVVQCHNCGQAYTTPHAQPAQHTEPVAWIHTKIDGVAVPHRPADLDKHPERWEALYKTPPPCQTCEALARTVMLDQTSHDTHPPRRTWVGLTDSQIEQVYFEVVKEHRGAPMPWGQVQFGRALQAKLKEKNT
jgi:hypothetical protein